MHRFDIEISRDGRWWIIHVPATGGVTQTRRLAEAEKVAREFIALDQNLPYREVEVQTVDIRMDSPIFGDLIEASRRIRKLRAEAQALEREAQRITQQFARVLTEQGIPVRDIAELVAISPQRVSQLANEPAATR